MNRIILLVLLLYIKSTQSATCTAPVEEGNSATITKTVSSLQNEDIVWKMLSADGVNYIVTSCNPDDNPVCESIFSGYSSTMTRDGSKYRVTLTLNSVRRRAHQTTFKWFDGAKELGECDLAVYSFPASNPSCNTLQISSSGDYVTWQCTVVNVYPEIECRFRYRKDSTRDYSDILSPPDVESEMTYTGTSSRSKLYSYTCTMNLPFNKLSAGSYQFRLSAAMHFTNIGESSIYRTKEQVITTEFPVAELVDCPNDDDPTQGYIQAGTTRKCGCRLKEVGIPPGVPRWKNVLDQLVGGTVVDGVTTLNLIYNANDPSLPSYFCGGHSAIGDGDPIPYTPKFAYGPSLVQTNLNDNSPTMNRCEPTASFNMYCDILVANANPKPTVTVTASDDSTITESESDIQSGYYRFRFKVVTQKGGSLTMTCVASNAIFPGIPKVDESKSVTVQEPPTSFPIMTVNGGQPVSNGGVITVTSGDTVQVTCRVDGGIPEVSKVTTTCAGKMNVKDGVEATQTISVGREDIGKKCLCQAEHVTGCYQKESEFTLNVHYTPTMPSYKVNSNTNELVISNQDNVTFLCDVDGNPRPGVMVRGQRSKEYVTLDDEPFGSFGKRNTGTKQMFCKDTDTYTCMADNGIGGGVEKSVTVFVKCSPEMSSGLDQTNKVFYTKNGTDLAIRVQIIGYPEPKDFSLKKVDTKGRRKRRSTTELTSNQYNAIYTPSQPPEGTVTLRVFDLFSGDSGQYVLTIDNGLGELDYEFNITIVAANMAGDEEDDDSSGLSTPAIIGIGLAVGLTLCLLFFLVGIKAGRKGWLQKKKENERTETMAFEQGQDNPTADVGNDLASYDRINRNQRQRRQAEGYTDVMSGAQANPGNNETPISAHRDDVTDFGGEEEYVNKDINVYEDPDKMVLKNPNNSDDGYQNQGLNAKTSISPRDSKTTDYYEYPEPLVESNSLNTSDDGYLFPDITKKTQIPSSVSQNTDGYRNVKLSTEPSEDSKNLHTSNDGYMYPDSFPKY